ncbi:MAG: transporter permease [Rickettsiaceae bacterium]|jgi:microcin C transport system permease protein|nr:transporter permease [Rickettsiaceae bacterium]
MYIYLTKRILLIVPTLFLIMMVNFLVVQSAPGGPVERLINNLSNANQVSGEAALTNHNFNLISGGQNQNLKYRGAQGIDPEIISKIEKLYGFDQPLWQRFWLMMKKYLVFDFGNSFYQDKSVISLVKERLPVSISLGLWATLLVYLISIPLGIKKAVVNGSKFDVYSSFIVIIGYAIPSFLFAIFLMVLFCGGNFLSIFPLRGLVSENFADLNWWQKIADYFWHLFLPVLSMVVGGFASLTFLCKNSFLEEINKQYVVAAKARGLNQRQILYRHIFRNALLIVIAGFPAALIGVIFTSSMLIEIIFSLNGLGLLGFEAAVSRDYPVMFGTLYFFTLLGLVSSIIGDLTYRLVDPRIDFEKHN